MISGYLQACPLVCQYGKSHWKKFPHFFFLQIYTTYRVLFTDSHHIVEKFHKLLVVEIFEMCENSKKLRQFQARCNRFHENLTSHWSSLESKGVRTFLGFFVKPTRKLWILSLKMEVLVISRKMVIFQGIFSKAA